MAVSLGEYTNPWVYPSAAVREMRGGPWDPKGTTSWRQLYLAIQDGVVRCRLNGQLVTDPAVITIKIWAEEERGGSGQGLYVNSDDVALRFNWDDYDLADLIAFALVPAVKASIMLETEIENLVVTSAPQSAIGSCPNGASTA